MQCACYPVSRRGAPRTIVCARCCAVLSPRGSFLSLCSLVGCFTFFYFSGGLVLRGVSVVFGALFGIISWDLVDSWVLLVFD